MLKENTFTRKVARTSAVTYQVICVSCLCEYEIRQANDWNDTEKLFVVNKCNCGKA